MREQQNLDSLLEDLFKCTKIYKETKDESDLKQMIKCIKRLELLQDSIVIYRLNRQKTDLQNLACQIKELSDEIEKNMSSGKSWIIPGVGWGSDAGRYEVFDSETGKRIL